MFGGLHHVVNTCDSCNLVSTLSYVYFQLSFNKFVDSIHLKTFRFPVNVIEHFIVERDAFQTDC